MQMMKRYNPYFINHHDTATYGAWRKPGRIWRCEKDNYGNVKASSTCDGTRFGKFKKKTQFQNRKKLYTCYKDTDMNKFNDSGVRFRPYGSKRGGDSFVTPVKSDLVASGCAFGEIPKEWGLDMYGTMSGLIRLKENKGENVVCDDVGSSDNCSDEGEDHWLFEKRLSKYEIVLPNSGFGVSSDLRSWRSSLLKKENLMLKESLFGMDKEMDDLKCRMEVVEMRIREKANEEVKEIRPGVVVCA